MSSAVGATDARCFSARRFWVSRLRSARGLDRLLVILPVSWRWPFQVLDALAVDAFVAYFMWLFVREFPESQPSRLAKRVTGVGLMASAVIGAMLFIANALMVRTPNGLPLLAAADARLAWAGRAASIDVSIYYPLTTTLPTLAIAIAVWKAHTARLAERRRVWVFLTALTVGIVPICAEFLLEATVPGYRDSMKDPAVRFARGLVVYPLLLVGPLGTTYSVVVDHVLDVRLIVRRTIQYALARYAVMAIVLLPFVGLEAYLYAHREQTLSELLEMAWPLLFITLVAAAVALRARRRVFNAIDRRFFREQYDARRALGEVVETSRDATTTAALARVVTQKIDQALHVESTAMLVREDSGRLLVALDGAVRPLTLASALADLLAGSTDPLEVDLEPARSPLRRLPEDQRQCWLTAFHLLVPLLGADRSLLGVIGLGEKRSELPFGADDRALLSAIAASSALALENRLLRSKPTPRSMAALEETAPGQPDYGDCVARECPRCRSIFSQETTTCDICVIQLADAWVPFVLAGKFRFEQRIGAGGMGIVYRALDLTLRRQVAIKTLPRISSEYATRLQRGSRRAFPTPISRRFSGPRAGGARRCSSPSSSMVAHSPIAFGGSRCRPST